MRRQKSRKIKRSRKKIKKTESENLRRSIKGKKKEG